MNNNGTKLKLIFILAGVILSLVVWIYITDRTAQATKNESIGTKLDTLTSLIQENAKQTTILIEQQRTSDMRLNSLANTLTSILGGTSRIEKFVSP